MMKTTDQNFDRNVWESLKYPVTLSIQQQETWHDVFIAETSADLEFKLSAYMVPREFDLLRMTESDGTQHHQKPTEVEEFDKHYIEEATRELEPLNAFVKSAPERAAEIANELIEAGLKSQHFSISPRSQVLLDHPNLHHLRLHEFDDCVVCRIHTTDAEVNDTEAMVTMWKKEFKNYEVVNSQKIDTRFSFSPFQINQEIQSFLILLVASIVRDFWVLEERTRQQVYQKRTEKRRKREGKGKARKMVVEKDYTFIPRFQYDLSVYQTTKTVQHQARVTLSPHLVSGHIRRLPEGHQASEEATSNAAEFGIRFGESETFVKPHERGEIEQLRNYRSRSAMQLLFGG